VATGEDVSVNDITVSTSPFNLMPNPSNSELRRIFGFANPACGHDDTPGFPITGRTHPSFQEELPRTFLGLERLPLEQIGIERLPQRPIDAETLPKSLWIQAGANRGEGLYIHLPFLNAAVLGFRNAIPPDLSGIPDIPGEIEMFNAPSSASTISDEPEERLSDAMPTVGYNPDRMKAEHLLSVLSVDEANSAIVKIDSAIHLISSERAQLGATSNRLEHAKKNADNLHENLTFSESTIRDLDMASEQMAFTKSNIIVQSAQAMLAQAQQLPQGVLELLR
jgi:hypothetical protein